MWISVRRSLRELRARLWRTATTTTHQHAGDDSVEFVCNLCNTPNRVPQHLLARETSSCATCRSTVRFRSVGRLVVRELLGQDYELPNLPASHHIVGIGLSDAKAYARPLARRFTYTNTFFDLRPKLDITAVPDSLAGRHDFVIASDVFEHVGPPVSRAFHGARRLLRPDGVLILTVPFSLDPDTVEHFPDLHDFRIVVVDGRRQLHNVTQDGRTQTFDNLVFHGGIGATLEMRVFSRAALERELREAGFSRVRFADEACPRFGIVRPEASGVPIVARP